VLARLEGAGLVTRRSSSRDRRSNDVAITDAGLDALAAAREVEKDALPPNLAEGAVLSRELVRVISYFPGTHRARAAGREKAETEAGMGGDRPAGNENPDPTTPAGAAEKSADRTPDTTGFDGASIDEAPKDDVSRDEAYDEAPAESPGRQDGRLPEEPGA
jgi:hypothetical protein